LKSITNQIRLFSKKEVPDYISDASKKSGLVSLLMIAKYYDIDKDHSLDQSYGALFEQYNLFGDSEVDNISLVAEQLKLYTRHVNIDTNNYGNIKLPCIIQYKTGNFSVLKEIKRNYVKVQDIYKGEIKIKMSEFRTLFFESCIELTQEEGFNSKNKKLKLSGFWPKSIGLSTAIIKILLLSFFLQIFVLVAPFHMQMVIDDVLVTHNKELLVMLTVGFLILLFFQTFTSAIRSLVITLLGNKLSVHMHSGLIGHLLRLPLSYFEKRHIGDVLSRIGSLGAIKELFTTTIVESIVDGLMIIGLLSMMFFYSVKLTIIALFFTLVYFVLRLCFYPMLRKAEDTNIKINAEKNTNLMESIRGIQPIKLYNQDRKRLNMFNNLNIKSSNSAIKLKKFEIGFEWSEGIISGFENIIFIYLVSNLVINGEFTVGMIIAFVAYKSMFISTTMGLIDNVIDVFMLSLHLDRISDIALSDQENNLGRRDKALEISGEIKLNNLSYRYPNAENYIVKNFNLKVSQGESLAIIGPSGCGKSTLMKIILGLLEPTSGSVLADGQDIKNMGLQNYRSCVASVMQNEVVMSGTILENIAFFEPSVNKQLIEDSALKAGIHWDIIAMKKGYDTMIGDMGVDLSGGQTQRIILARALYKQPKILFLDEATSNLDVDLECYINDTIKSLNITRIFIAHRPETIKSADRIIQYQQGTFVDISLEKVEKSIA
jgi:ATP-binding cassette subfamily B protein RaxB